MKVVCAWCKEDMGEKEPLEDKDATHSMCPKCQIKFYNDPEYKGAENGLQ